MSTAAVIPNQQTLAERVRAKFPGAYDDMDDNALEQKVLAKHPEYSDLPRSTQIQPDEPVPPSFGQRLTAPYNPSATEFGEKHPIAGPLVRGLDAAGGAALSIPSFLVHMLSPSSEQQQPQNPDAVMNMVQRLAAPVAESIDTYSDPKTRPTLKEAASVLPEALGQGVGTVGASEGLARSLPFLRGVVDKIPSKARAGANFQDVMGAAKNVPIDTTAPGNAALQLKDFASRGGRLPKVVNDFLRRATDPNQGPLTYEEARDFAQNAGKLSVNERNALSPNVQRMVSKFARELNDANEAAAAQVGKGEQYQSAMREYRQRSQFNNAGQKVVDYAGQQLAEKLPWLALGYGVKKAYSGK